MIDKTPKEHQISIFEVALESFIDMNHELALFSSGLTWAAVDLDLRLTKSTHRRLFFD